MVPEAGGLEVGTTCWKGTEFGITEGAIASLADVCLSVGWRSHFEEAVISYKGETDIGTRAE